MIVYRIIKIKNHEPVKVGASGNKTTYTEKSCDYIPGSTIRGALIGRMIYKNLFTEETKKKILLHMFCFNAYPAGEDRIFFPVPFHLRVDKHELREKRTNQDSTIKMSDAMEGVKENKAKNALPYSFICTAGDKEESKGLNVRKEYRLHNSTVKNADKKERENIFRYEAMCSGQSFWGIVGYEDCLEEIINELFKEELPVYLGGSKGSGYGKSSIYSESEATVGFEVVKNKFEIKNSTERTDRTITVTCLSDCIFRNRAGQPVNYIPEEIIGSEAKLEASCIQSGLTEGYNTKWNARYPKETTLKAGSAFRYSFSEEISTEKIRSIKEKLEQKLWGSRTQDGYGWLGADLAYSLNLSLQPVGTAYEADKDLVKLKQEIEQDEKAKKVFSIITKGLEDAKKRWLTQLVLNTFEEEAGKKLIIRIEQKSRLQYIKRFFKKEVSAHAHMTDLNNREKFAWCNCSGKEIFGYLNKEKQKSNFLEEVEQIFKTQKADLFYYGKEEQHKEFVKDFILTALDVKIKNAKSQGGEEDE